MYGIRFIDERRKIHFEIRLFMNNLYNVRIDNFICSGLKVTIHFYMQNYWVTHENECTFGKSIVMV